MSTRKDINASCLIEMGYFLFPTYLKNKLVKHAKRMVSEFEACYYFPIQSTLQLFSKLGPAGSQ